MTNNTEYVIGRFYVFGLRGVRASIYRWCNRQVWERFPRHPKVRRSQTARLVRWGWGGAPWRHAEYVAA